MQFSLFPNNNYQDLEKEVLNPIKYRKHLKKLLIEIKVSLCKNKIQMKYS